MLLSNSLVAVIAAISVSQSAGSAVPSPGWNYARWGMTPEEVVSASNGEARLHAPPPVPGATGRTLAVGTMSGGAINFVLSFTFDPSRALTHVNLNAPPAECPAVIRELYRVYGTPYHSPRSTYAVQASWEDRSKNLNVSLFGSGGSCLITYSPARPAVRGL